MRIEGPRIVLRELRVDDAEGPYLQWVHDPEVTRYLEVRFRPPDLDGLRGFISAQLEDPDVHFFAIELAEDERHIGNIKLGPVDHHHERAEIGLLIGARESWGKGYGREAIELVSTWAFDHLGLRKVTAGAYSTNVGSLRAFERAGFVVEGMRPGHFRDGDTWVDHVLMARERSTPENRPREDDPRSREGAERAADA